MVVMPSKLQKGLPRRTGSLCPECLKVIPATLYIGDGALKMKKTCKEHGEFDEVCWSDAEMYLKAENWAFDGVGLENPQIVDAKVCPYECGLCNLHYSATSLCNIDLTNRCNLKCPICFANANAAGYVFEPTFEQIIYEFAVIAGSAADSGGRDPVCGREPTIYPQFPEIVKASKDMGFAQVQVATNGIRLATEDGFLDKSPSRAEHDLPAVRRSPRGELHQGARPAALGHQTQGDRARPRAQGEGHHHPDDLLRADDGQLLQRRPGRRDSQLCDQEPRRRQGRQLPAGEPHGSDPRGRPPEAAIHPERLGVRPRGADGYLTRDDWYRCPSCRRSRNSCRSSRTPPSRRSRRTRRAPRVVPVLESGKDPVPITRFVDVEGLMEDLWLLAQDTKEKKIKFTSKLKALQLLKRHFKPEDAPEGMGLSKMLKS